MVLPFDRIYCISLKKAVARRRLIDRHLAQIGGLTDRHGNGIEWVEAKDGNNHSHPVDNSLKRKNRLGRISFGEIGCFESHRIVWQKFLSEQTGTCLVLEDDFRIQAVSDLVFPNWDKMPDWDYVNFGFITNPKSIHDTLSRQNHAIWKNLWAGAGMWLTHAYAINETAARVFLDYTRVQQGGIDWQLTGAQKLVKSFGFMQPSIITQDKLPSQIVHTQ